MSNSLSPRRPSSRGMSGERESTVILHLANTEPRVKVFPPLQKRRKNLQSSQKPSVKVKELSIQETTSTSDILKVPSQNLYQSLKNLLWRKIPKRKRRRLNQDLSYILNQNSERILALLILNLDGTIDPNQDHTHLEGGQI